jgi:hypothetical protein
LRVFASVSSLKLQFFSAILPQVVLMALGLAKLNMRELRELESIMGFNAICFRDKADYVGRLEKQFYDMSPACCYHNGSLDVGSLNKPPKP